MIINFYEEKSRENNPKRGAVMENHLFLDYRTFRNEKAHLL